MKNTDYIIIGQGIAGSTLSLMLQERGHSVLVVDDESQPKSSMVAAGIFNPVTGRKMVKTWKAIDLWPAMIRFYSSIEKKANTKLLYYLNQFRPFLDEHEFISYSNGDATDRFEQFAGEVVSGSPSPDLIKADHGGLFVNQTGYLDIPQYLRAAKNIIINNGEFINSKVTFGDLKIEDNHVELLGYSAKKIIFCDGWHGAGNSFFDWIPFSPVRGDVLHFHNDVQMDIMVNRGAFILPHYSNIIKVGSTYDHKNLNFTPDEGAKIKLIDKIKGLLNVELKLTGHYAGVRPSTKDRKPVVGLHPQHKNIGIFNGLGTKGVSLAPYFAENFVNFIENNGLIETEVHIERFYSLYLNA